MLALGLAVLAPQFASADDDKDALELALGETSTNHLSRIPIDGKVKVESSNPDVATGEWVEGRSPHLLIRAIGEGEATITVSGNVRKVDLRGGRLGTTPFNHFTDVKVSGETDNRSLTMHKRQYQFVRMPEEYRIVNGSVEVLRGESIVSAKQNSAAGLTITAKDKLGDAVVDAVVLKKTAGGGTQRVRLSIYVDVVEGKGKRQRPAIALFDLKIPVLGIVILNPDGTSATQPQVPKKKQADSDSTDNRQSSAGQWELEDEDTKVAMVGSHNLTGHDAFGTGIPGSSTDIAVRSPQPPPTLSAQPGTGAHPNTAPIVVNVPNVPQMRTVAPEPENIARRIPQDMPLRETQPDPLLSATLRTIRIGIRHGAGSSDICALMDFVVAASLTRDFFGGLLTLQHTDPSGRVEQQTMRISQTTQVLMMLRIYAYGLHYLQVMSVVSSAGVPFVLDGNLSTQINVGANEPDRQLCR